jgi:gas vesicle protein
MTTSNDPDAIRAQIEQTQRELSYDVDALNEKVNPARVMDRRVTAAKGRITSVKEKVMGSAQNARSSVMGSAQDTTSTAQYHAQNAVGTVQDKASSAAGSVQDAASSAASAVQQAPDTIVRQTQGNPLAAGLIAFGVGWLVSSLLPASDKERQLAQQAESAIRENKDALLAPAKQAAQEIGDQLKPAAQQAVQEVKSTAQDAAATVKEEGQAAAQDVQGQAQESRQTVQSQTRS